MCTNPNGTCPSGMVLHIKSYTLHGLISHRDNSNVNHISSLILSNICIKTLIHRSIAQDITKTYNTRLKKNTRCPIGLVSTRKGKSPRKFHPSHVSEVKWLGDVQTCGWSESQGCIMLSVSAFVEGELYLLRMHFFQARSCLYSFPLFVFSSSFSFYSRANQRTLPWHGDQS
jgi:hypothetical protein